MTGPLSTPGSPGRSGTGPQRLPTRTPDARDPDPPAHKTSTVCRTCGRSGCADEVEDYLHRALRGTQDG